ncbi:MAG: MFS transporter, partial [Pseudomonadota bacterium]
NASTTYLQLVPGMIILGIGIGFFYSSITPVAVTALGSDRASLASGAIYMVNVTGGALGLGMNTAIVASAETLAEGIRLAFLVNGGLALVGLLVTIIFIHNAPKTAD